MSVLLRLHFQRFSRSTCLLYRVFRVNIARNLYLHRCSFHRYGLAQYCPFIVQGREETSKFFWILVLSLFFAQGNYNSQILLNFFNNLTLLKNRKPCSWISWPPIPLQRVMLLGLVSKLYLSMVVSRWYKRKSQKQATWVTKLWIMVLALTFRVFLNLQIRQYFPSTLYNPNVNIFL